MVTTEADHCSIFQHNFVFYNQHRERGFHWNILKEFKERYSKPERLFKSRINLLTRGIKEERIKYLMYLTAGGLKKNFKSSRPIQDFKRDLFYNLQVEIQIEKKQNFHHEKNCLD